MKKIFLHVISSHSFPPLLPLSLSPCIPVVDVVDGTAGSRSGTGQSTCCHDCRTYTNYYFLFFSFFFLVLTPFFCLISSFLFFFFFFCFPSSFHTSLLDDGEEGVLEPAIVVDDLLGGLALDGGIGDVRVHRGAVISPDC